MKKILILSHTGEYSYFKIGSHHYANGLSNIYDVTYIGTPHTLLHKVLRKKVQGVSMLNKSVFCENLSFILPVTIKYNSLFSTINKVSHSLSRIFDEKKNYDVIICDYPFFSPYLDFFNYKKLIYRPTDVYAHMAGDKVHKYEKEIISKSDAVIGTSQEVITYLIKNYSELIRGKHPEIIQNGYDHNMFSCGRNNEMRSGNVYIGALDYRFDFEMLKYLAGKFREDIFDIYGPIASQYISITDEIKKEYKNINFKGSIDYAKVPNTLREYKIGLLLLNESPSNLGRSPMKIWEYAASGLQILYTGARVKEDYSFLFYYDKENVEEKYLLAKNSKINERELEKIKKYSWENNVEKINVTIERLLHE